MLTTPASCACTGATDAARTTATGIVDFLIFIKIFKFIYVFYSSFAGFNFNLRF